MLLPHESTVAHENKLESTGSTGPNVSSSTSAEQLIAKRKVRYNIMIGKGIQYQNITVIGNDEKG